MTVSAAKLKANSKYRQKYKYLQARITSEEKETIVEHCKNTNESLNEFMRRAFAETVEKDKKQF